MADPKKDWARPGRKRSRCTPTAYWFAWTFAALLITLEPLSAQVPQSGGTHCDPTKVLTSEGCIKCHTQADAVWKQTPHFKTFSTLHRNPAARQIAQKMGVSSIKRGDVCVRCHYTQVQKESGSLKAVSGVSCESCHGAGKDWVPIHNDYGGLGASKATESAEHARQRLQMATRAGMRNPHNLYRMAQSCLGCHTVPNEKLVNIGGHTAGSNEFEMVAWSQGTIRHNFLRTDGKSNAESTPARLRLMWLCGQIADLEFSTRAVARATTKNTYGLTVAKRAADKALALYRVQQSLKHPILEQILQAFAKAELKTGNSEQLNSIADEIARLGEKLADQEDGSDLTPLDKFLPDRNRYK